MNLYKFSHSSTTETLLLVTPEPRIQNALRSEMCEYDHGGMDADLFALLISKGTITEVFSFEECGEGWTLDMLPYGYMDDDGNYGTLEMIFKELVPKTGLNKRLEEIDLLFRQASPIIGSPCEVPDFGSRKFVKNERGEVVLEVIRGNSSDQKFYADAYQNVKFLLEHIERLRTRSPSTEEDL